MYCLKYNSSIQKMDVQNAESGKDLLDELEAIKNEVEFIIPVELDTKNNEA